MLARTAATVKPASLAARSGSVTALMSPPPDPISPIKPMKRLAAVVDRSMATPAKLVKVDEAAKQGQQSPLRSPPQLTIAVSPESPTALLIDADIEDPEEQDTNSKVPSASPPPSLPVEQTATDEQEKTNDPEQNEPDQKKAKSKPAKITTGTRTSKRKTVEAKSQPEVIALG